MRAALIGIVLSVLPLPTQVVPVVNLDKPHAEFPTGYASLAGMRELRDGRVIVADRCEHVLKLLDFATRTESQIGRTGSGPNEYRSPGPPLPFLGDSSLVTDPGNNRMLLLDPTGKPVRLVETPATAGPLAPSSRVLPVFGDVQGRVYARETGFKLLGDQLAGAESVAVLRWRAGSARRDTIGFTGPVRPLGSPSGGRPQVDAYPPYDQWVVGPDGRLAVLHVIDYRVDFVWPDGKRVRGRPIPYARVPVTNAHKEQWKRDHGLPCGGVPPSATTSEDGRKATLMFVGPAESDWPAFLPPFLAGAGSFAPDGMLWIRLAGGVDEPLTYDVIDPTGNWQSEWRCRRIPRCSDSGRRVCTW